MKVWLNVVCWLHAPRRSPAKGTRGKSEKGDFFVSLSFLISLKMAMAGCAIHNSVNVKNSSSKRSSYAEGRANQSQLEPRHSVIVVIIYEEEDIIPQRPWKKKMMKMTVQVVKQQR